MVDLAKSIQARVAEREAILDRIIEQLSRDERVVAAWLYGSLGRQEMHRRAGL